MTIFLIWLAVAEAIYVANFGYGAPTSVPQFVDDLFNTSSGWNLIIMGTGVGFLFAVLTLTISAVSFPLLLDRDVGAAVALLTSIRVVATNPVTMALWGLIVAAPLVIGSVAFFLGLTVVIPVLGHATWHLYRRAVEPDPIPAPPVSREKRVTGPLPISRPYSSLPSGSVRVAKIESAEIWRVNVAHCRRASYRADPPRRRV